MVRVVMPSIGVVEVLNALRKYVARGLLEAGYVAEAVELLSGSGIELYHVDWGLAGEALRLALERGLSVYDGVYVALARRLGAELYTADQEVVKRAGVDFVKHVREYGS
ncbi:type II toxin-antitoxin system VapC family toxin [Pyrobaculum sp. 3827-6]|uniref:type II toxin-antitoxin system VapC family toxin n=1 Tax=Pyrobaculum sp. 3827-6 TaxID=2983604 RepID=UPI0021DACE8B|nr:type II toxin-antitoxin system VapC family toxin [Pyrobaculum sp. 3827-6]MCU7788635.1 type II toxin-antitoxin system VapC family toxin [Pyrobaculum sp. 3827-6]